MLLQRDVVFDSEILDVTVMTENIKKLRMLFRFI